MGTRSKAGFTRLKGKKQQRQTVFVIGLVLLVFGVMLLYMGTTDYTDHTERADATVVEREVDYTYDDGDRRKKDVDVYVDFAAGGAEHHRVELEGIDSASFDEGDTLTVAYAPGEPGHAVTVQSTEKGAYVIGFYLGIPVVLAGAAVTVVAIVLLLRKKG